MADQFCSGLIILSLEFVKEAEISKPVVGEQTVLKHEGLLEANPPGPASRLSGAAWRPLALMLAQALTDLTWADAFQRIANIGLIQAPVGKTHRSSRTAVERL